MAGSTFSFNPTVELTDGSNFVYTNTESGSTLPAGPINGTYTFTRNSDTEATITLNGTGVGGTGIDTVDFVLTNFTGTASAITGFTVSVDGATFIATVDSGTVAPGPIGDGGDGGDAGDAGDGDGGNGGGIPDIEGATPATIDPGFVGTHTLYFNYPQADSILYEEGDQVTFEITADGKLMFDGNTLTDPFFLNGNEFEVFWFDGTNSYAASGNGSLNEINFGSGLPGEGTYLGQFNTNQP